MPVQRYKLTIAYRGTRYHGWQRQSGTGPDLADADRPTIDESGDAPDDAQVAPSEAVPSLVETPDDDSPDAGQPHADPPGAGSPSATLSAPLAAIDTTAAADTLPTIQESVSRALASIVCHPLNLVGSSRTDARVHAKGQVAHFDTDQLQIPPDNLRRAVNHRLPEDIVIRTLEPVANDFDAIRWTVKKRYQYFIWNHRNRNPFGADLSWHRWQELDVESMNAAARMLEGEHDFTSFARTGHGRGSAVRRLYHCTVSRRGPLVIVGLESNGFLWNMCRIIVGTLVEIGQGRRHAHEIPPMLRAAARPAAGPTAPPQGLYLHWIQFRDV